MQKDKKNLRTKAAAMAAKASELLEKASEEAIKEKDFDEANLLLCWSLDAIKLSNKIKFSGNTKKGESR